MLAPWIPRGIPHGHLPVGSASFLSRTRAKLVLHAKDPSAIVPPSPAAGEAKRGTKCPATGRFPACTATSVGRARRDGRHMAANRGCLLVDSTVIRGRSSLRRCVSISGPRTPSSVCLRFPPHRGGGRPPQRLPACHADQVRAPSGTSSNASREMRLCLRMRCRIDPKRR